MDNKLGSMPDSLILYALRSDYARGNVDKAVDLLLAISGSCEGIVIEYDPNIKLLGAENRQGVTCYLDSVLFAMLSRLDSFEAMLHNRFEDEPRRKLALLLRLWVNLLRSGKLITTDITKLVQESLAECGWEEAKKLRQQDVSEAFTFITGKLELPLLTLKMDIHHAGKEDAKDDHKYINERLLEVAIPSHPDGEIQQVTLEECLESYFNNRVEVRRYLERRSTMSSMRSVDSSAKRAFEHVETIEVDPDSTPSTPSAPPIGSASSRTLRLRTPSIIQERFIPENNTDTTTTSTTRMDGGTKHGRFRKGSIRKEVVMPAWQFFSLIRMYNIQAVRAHTDSS